MPALFCAIRKQLVEEKQLTTIGGKHDLNDGVVTLMWRAGFMEQQKPSRCFR